MQIQKERIGGNQKKSITDELLLALQSTKEIQSAQTLHKFIHDLQKSYQVSKPFQDLINQLQDKYKLRNFLKSVIICTEQDYQKKDIEEKVSCTYSLKYKNNFQKLLDENIYDLIQEGKKYHLQTSGYLVDQQEKLNKKITVKYLNLNKTEMMTKEWETVYIGFGDELFSHLYRKYMIFQKTQDDSFIQISGSNIFEYINEKFGKQATYQQAPSGEQDAVIQSDKQKQDYKSHKYNIITENDNYKVNQLKLKQTMPTINRNKIFYCTHLNRKNQFFKGHFFQSKKSTEEVLQEVIEQSFGFMRIRRALKEKLNKIVRHIIEKQKTFDYSYYLSKNAPLPSNWKQRKQELEELAKRPLLRNVAFKELFDECNSQNEQVGNFLDEFVAQVFPKNFLKGNSQYNQKMFRECIMKFIDFNRYESFTKETILTCFQVDNIDWLKYTSNSQNSYYFKRENEFVWWNLIKWIFEDIFSQLIRCYFYATEKQKESSKIFYYRKNVWNMIMKLSTEDLLNQNIEKVTKKEMKEKCECNNFAPAKLRLIPKGDTFRPIMTFNRKLPHSKMMTTNKKLSYAHLALKNMKQKMNQNGVGFAVFNYDDIMKKYENFVLQWKNANKPQLYFVTMDIEKCYDSVNVSNLKKLLQRTDLIERDYYQISCLVLKRKNNVLVERENIQKEPFKTHFRHKYQKLSVDGGTLPNLMEVVSQENDFNFKRSLIIESDQRKKMTKNEVLTPIEYIIQNNYITFNKLQFKQKKGIPQGMCVSYILSSFYYSCLEDQALKFIKKEQKQQIVPDKKQDLNCVMRLTDDYLLITTSKENALLFIERLFALSNENGFRFNAKKLRANFPVNVDKLNKITEKKNYQQPAQKNLDNQISLQNNKTKNKNAAVEEKGVDYESKQSGMFNWIGISIHMESLGLVPNMQLSKEAILCTLNINMSTKKSILWIKRKLKSFLMNNVSFYFRSTITSKQFANQTLEKLYFQAAEKYLACCREFKKYHSKKYEKCQDDKFFIRIDLKLSQIIYVVIHSFFKYLVCNIRGGTVFDVNDPNDYKDFFTNGLRYFTERFKKSKNEFSQIHKILNAKTKRIQSENLVFHLNRDDDQIKK